MVLFQVCFVRSLAKERRISSRTSESAVATYHSLGALRDTTTDNKAECFHSLHDPVFKSLSSAIKEAIFEKSLLVHLETIRKVAKIDHAQGQIQCSNTRTLFLCQKLPYKRLMGMFRWKGSYFDVCSDYNGAAFSVQFLEWGSTFSDLWCKTLLHIYG